MSKRKFYLKIIITVLLFVCFSFAAFSNSKIDPNKPDTKTKMSQEQLAKNEQQIVNSLTKGFNASLEMKENVEFLLTPALLMQEAMSSEIQVTYPTE